MSSKLDINDLGELVELLKRCDFSDKDWFRLGLSLGLAKGTLDSIEVNHKNDVHRCLIQCLSEWLKRTDNVDKKGGVTYDSLSKALKSLGFVAVADKLDQERNPQGLESATGPHTEPEVESSDMTYIAQVYHEKIKDGYWKCTLTVVKDSINLKMYLQEHHPNAITDDRLTFKFDKENHLQLQILPPLAESGWSISPHQNPMMLSQKIVDRFQSNPIYTSLTMSLYAKPDEPAKSLKQPIFLLLADPIKIIEINIDLGEDTPPIDFCTFIPTDSLHEINVIDMQGVIGRVLIRHFAELSSYPEVILKSLASSLCSSKFISEAVQKSNSVDDIMSEIILGFTSISNVYKLRQHCVRFLLDVSSVGGACTQWAKTLQNKWSEACKNELHVITDFDMSGRSTYKGPEIYPDIAYQVLERKAPLVKEAHMDLHSLADKIFKRKVISANEKKEIIDEESGLTADQRMDKLLNIIIAATKLDGEVLNTFAEVLKEEDTTRGEEIADEILFEYMRVILQYY